MSLIGKIYQGSPLKSKDEEIYCKPAAHNGRYRSYRAETGAIGSSIHNNTHEQASRLVGYVEEDGNANEATDDQAR